MICHTVLLTACEQDQDGTLEHPVPARKLSAKLYNTLRTGDADLRFYGTTVQDG